MAQIENGNHRTALVKKRYDKISESFEPDSILTITPACECEQQKLLAFFKRIFKHLYSAKSGFS